MLLAWRNGVGVVRPTPLSEQTKLVIACSASWTIWYWREKNAVNCCRLIITDRYQPQSIFFPSCDSWELATLIVSCLGELIRMGWSCLLHKEICTYKNKVCVWERERKQKLTTLTDVASGLSEWNSFKFNIMHHGWHSCSPTLHLSPVFEPKQQHFSFIDM